MYDFVFTIIKSLKQCKHVCMSKQSSAFSLFLAELH